MIRVQLLLSLFGVWVTIFVSSVQAERPQERRIKEVFRIVEGDTADGNQFPYQVVLEAYSITFCGGSILSERFVITAAHCVIRPDGTFKNYPIKVIAGISDLKSKSDNKVIVDVIKVYVPKEYDPTTMYKYETGDIAILKLNKDLDIRGNSNLGKVKFPRKSTTYDEVEATVSGFGFSEMKIITNPKTGFSKEKGKSSDKLRYAKANVMSTKDCQKKYALVKISEKHICAAVVQHNKRKPRGVCSGDSGGPLVYRGAQIGVLSNSAYGCREDSRPAIYTRVSEYLDFIQKVVGDNTDDSIRTTTLKIRD